MYSQLQALLMKPKLFEKTTAQFWSDEHISKGMLEAHLNPNTDAASRKPAFIDQATTWIASLLPPGSTLLDIGCGPGLYTKRLAERGLTVTGLDFSARSIAYAKEHDPKSTYVLQSYLEMEFENAFDMITLIWCDYAALVPEDRLNLLHRVHRALKPGGYFLFDVFTPLWNQGKKESQSWSINDKGGFWSAHPHICFDADFYFENNLIDVNRIVLIEEQEVRCLNIWNTCFTKESVQDELQPMGFTVLQFYASVTGIPYSDSTNTLCVVATKK
jgi:SAM-dependent methyltransferase